MEKQHYSGKTPRANSGYGAVRNTVNERKGFEAFCMRTNPKYKPTDDSVIDRALWKTWQEACAWQRKQDLQLSAAMLHMQRLLNKEFRPGLEAEPEGIAPGTES